MFDYLFLASSGFPNRPIPSSANAQSAGPFSSEEQHFEKRIVTNGTASSFRRATTHGDSGAGETAPVNLSIPTVQSRSEPALARSSPLERSELRVQSGQRTASRRALSWDAFEIIAPTNVHHYEQRS